MFRRVAPDSGAAAGDRSPSLRRVSFATRLPRYHVEVDLCLITSAAKMVPRVFRANRKLVPALYALRTLRLELPKPAAHWAARARARASRAGAKSGLACRACS